MNYFDWKRFDDAVIKLAEQLEACKQDRVICGAMRGGFPLAVALSHRLQIPMTTRPSLAEQRLIWVDDMLDSGTTYEDAKLSLPKDTVFAVWAIRQNKIENSEVIFAEEVNDEWIVFPWEVNENALTEKKAYETKYK